MRTLITLTVIITALWSGRCHSGERPSPPRGFEYEIQAGPEAHVKTNAGTESQPRAPAASFDAASAPTPMAEVVRVLGLLPKPEIAFVEFGSGADARWCVAAVEKWGCRAIGIEIDPSRAVVARERVREAGLSHLITIIHGDAIITETDADIGVAYLWPETLAKLKPRIEKLRAFASYMHTPPGITTVKNGDSFLCFRPAVQQAVVAQPRAAIWNGVAYSGRVCANRNCAMCNSIEASIAAAAKPEPVAKTGRYVKHCNGRSCWWEWIPNQ